MSLVEASRVDDVKSASVTVLPPRLSSPRAPWFYLAANVPLITLIYLFPRIHVYLWGLLGLSSASAIVLGTLRNKPAYRFAWILIASGVTTFALGDISYDVLTEFIHESNPFPSVADAFYIVTYLLLAAGLVAMVRARRPRDDGSGPMLDALIVTSGIGVLSWVYLIEPYMRAVDISILPGWSPSRTHSAT